MPRYSEKAAMPLSSRNPSTRYSPMSVIKGNITKPPVDTVEASPRVPSPPPPPGGGAIIQSQSGSCALHKIVRGPLRLPPSEISCARRELFSGSGNTTQLLRIAASGNPEVSASAPPPAKQEGGPHFTPFRAEDCWQPSGKKLA